MQRTLKTLALVLAALSFAPSAQALRVAEQGIGQVLIFPFYSVDGGIQTLLTVVNTSARAKAIRVTFNEARNGQPVLAFNLYLGPLDAWVGGLSSVNDSRGPAVIVTNDSSCTVPAPALPVTGIVANLQPFSYTGPNSDHPAWLPALDAIERTRSGFIEMIEMGELQAGTGPLQFAEEVTAGATGVPTRCAALVNAWQLPESGGFPGNWSVDPANGIDLPGGGLYGSAMLIDVPNGTLYSYPAVALEGFYTDAAAPGGLHQAPQTFEPTLRNANSGGGQVVVDVALADGSVQQERFVANNDILPVSLALLQSRLHNEYNFLPSIGAATEWVVTFPTKRFHVSERLTGPFARAPFRDLFDDDGRGAVFATTTRVDRAGRREVLGECRSLPLQDPPAPCNPFRRSLDNSVNVLAFGQSTAAPSRVLGAISDQVRVDGGLDANSFAGATTGHLTIEFIQPSPSPVNSTSPTATPPQPYVLVGPSGRRYLGLPALGLSFARYTNIAARPGLLATYGDAVPHRGERRLLPENP